jgi:hypothetical protein
MKKREMIELCEAQRGAIDACHDLIARYASEIDGLSQELVSMGDRLQMAEHEKDVLRNAFNIAAGRLAAHSKVPLDKIEDFADGLLAEAEAESQLPF